MPGIVHLATGLSASKAWEPTSPTMTEHESNTQLTFLRGYFQSVVLVGALRGFESRFFGSGGRLSWRFDG